MNSNQVYEKFKTNEGITLENADQLENKGSNSSLIGLQIWYKGLIKSIKVGTGEFSKERSPSLLAWIVGLPGVETIGSVLAVLLTIGFVAGRTK